ncbi:hypothetical protein D9615_000770 [Tricholomella constricta]|uniref:Uncharacterized protein n=1 Tax=Tricholomella constricta TaxID=117010 RepID=A0A8H5HR01_9AGAR|nr:hypothetical protein D9615_000770 [Tricholomella constricta]
MDFKRRTSFDVNFEDRLPRGRWAILPPHIYRDHLKALADISPIRLVVGAHKICEDLQGKPLLFIAHVALDVRDVDLGLGDRHAIDHGSAGEVLKSAQVDMAV